MIGAMPAVAVRHERRRAEKRSKRPSLLYLQSTQSRSTSPSPVQSSPGLYSTPQLEIYILGRVSIPSSELYNVNVSSRKYLSGWREQHLAIYMLSFKRGMVYTKGLLPCRYTEQHSNNKGCISLKSAEVDNVACYKILILAVCSHHSTRRYIISSYSSSVRLLKACVVGWRRREWRRALRESISTAHLPFH